MSKSSLTTEPQFVLFQEWQRYNMWLQNQNNILTRWYYWFQNRNSELQGAIQNITEKHAGLETDHNILQQESQQQKEQLKNFQKRQEELQERNRELQQKTNELHNEKLQLTENIRQMYNETKQLESEKQQKEKQVEEKTKIIDMLNKKHKVCCSETNLIFVAGVNARMRSEICGTFT